MRPLRLLRFAAVLLLAGCGLAEEEVLEQARSDMSCQAVAARLLHRSDDGAEEYWLIEGCASVRHYECTGSLLGYDCRAIGHRELPAPPLRSY